MVDHVCPWWGGYFLDNRFRRWLHNPHMILDSYVREGMTVMDFGCGMGLFSIAMAEMVGDDGTVIAADLQPQMLGILKKRAEKVGLASRIRTHVCDKTSIGVEDEIDFVLAFWSAHEAPDFKQLLTEVQARLVSNGRMLLVEPRGHVSKQMFDGMMETARDIGLEINSRPIVRLSHAAEFVKT